MGVVEKVKFWRTAGKLIDSGIGQALADPFRGVVNKVVTAGARSWQDEIPWAPFEKTFSESRPAVVLTAGFHLKSDAPFDVDAARGDPTFREFPSDFDKEDIQITHTHYSHQRVNQDMNVILPIDRLRELVDAGVLAGLAPRFFSSGFAGGITRAFIDPDTGTAHEVARRLKYDDADFVLLVPA